MKRQPCWHLALCEHRWARSQRFSPVYICWNLKKGINALILLLNRVLSGLSTAMCYLEFWVNFIINHPAIQPPLTLPHPLFGTWGLTHFRCFSTCMAISLPSVRPPSMKKSKETKQTALHKTCHSLQSKAFDYTQSYMANYWQMPTRHCLHNRDFLPSEQGPGETPDREELGLLEFVVIRLAKHFHCGPSVRTCK